jgi:hypothetical protein
MNYESHELDIDDNSLHTFRPLNKAIGSIDKSKESDAMSRFEMWGRDTDMASFHYGSHYSCSGIVLYYLLRLEPYTT